MIIKYKHEYKWIVIDVLLEGNCAFKSMLYKSENNWNNESVTKEFQLEGNLLVRRD